MPLDHNGTLCSGVGDPTEICVVRENQRQELEHFEDPPSDAETGDGLTYRNVAGY